MLILKLGVAVAFAIVSVYYAVASITTFIAALELLQDIAA